ncbi:MAG TPA: hypothetical protein VGP70_01700 [Actinomadura sp.]|jgi:hypothetical protein|nr:hypothetical protein [Actinomadura sp.]
MQHSSGPVDLGESTRRIASGRGLFVVGSMAVDHGAHLTPTGKAVWFELVAWPVAPT